MVQGAEMGSRAESITVPAGPCGRSSPDDSAGIFLMIQLESPDNPAGVFLTTQLEQRDSKLFLQTAAGL